MDLRERCRIPDHSLLLFIFLKIKTEVHYYAAPQEIHLVSPTKKIVGRTLPANFLSSGLQQSAFLKLKNDLQFCFKEQENLDNWCGSFCTLIEDQFF